MSFSTTYPFTTSSNYTFDSNLIEFDSGVARLKVLSEGESDQLLKATARHQTDADYSESGNVTATLGTNTTRELISGVYYYVMTTNTAAQDSVAFNGANADFGAIGTIRWKFRPDYSGSPSTRQELVVASAGVSNNANLILLRHDTDGGLDILMSGFAASITSTEITNSWSPVADTDYELELNIDLTTGATRLFVDGEQLGITVTTAKTVSSRGQFKFGVDTAGNGTINGSVRDIEVFDTVQHTSNFTGEIPRVVPTYSTANPTVVVNSGFSTDALEGFSETVTAVGSDTVKYVLRFDGQDKYYNGSAWVDSDGTYSQSNTAAEIETNKASFDISEGGTLVIKCYLHSENGDTTPELDAITATYSFFISGVVPTRCVCYGYILDNSAVPIKKRVHVYSEQPFLLSGNAISVNEVLTDENGDFTSEGYYNVTLPDTTTPDVKLMVEESWVDSRGKKQEHKYRIKVPASTSATFSSMKV